MRHRETGSRSFPLLPRLTLRTARRLRLDRGADVRSSRLDGPLPEALRRPVRDTIVRLCLKPPQG